MKSYDLWHFWNTLRGTPCITLKLAAESENEVHFAPTTLSGGYSNFKIVIFTGTYTVFFGKNVEDFYRLQYLVIILELKNFFQQSAILQRLFDGLAMLQYIAILQRLLAINFLQYCRGEIRYLTRSGACARLCVCTGPVLNCLRLK